MNQSINTDSKNSKEPQQKYRLGTVSIKILGGLNRFYRRLTSPSASIMAQNIQLFGPRGGFLTHQGSSRETNKSQINTMMKQRWGLDRNVLRPTPGDPWGVEHHHWHTGAEENQQLNPGGPSNRQKSSGPNVSVFSSFFTCLFVVMLAASASNTYIGSVSFRASARQISKRSTNDYKTFRALVEHSFVLLNWP